jgi:transcriptional regulator with XRE-family HTH domain
MMPQPNSILIQPFGFHLHRQLFHTDGMPTSDEKQLFSTRLKQALKRSPKKVESASDLALQFNLRHPTEPVTVQAAQKWLTGQAKPTVDKIATLAAWLNVSPQWLRYGIAEERASQAQQRAKSDAAQSSPPTAEELSFLEKVRALPEHRRGIVFEIVEQFGLDQEMWHN